MPTAILFATDGPRVAERLNYHWRFLETEDEYFPYAENEFPPQGFWRIYGVNLPDDVLRKVYFENAERLIPGVRERLRGLLGSDSSARRSTELGVVAATRSGRYFAAAQLLAIPPTPRRTVPALRHAAAGLWTRPNLLATVDPGRGSPSG